MISSSKVKLMDLIVLNVAWLREWELGVGTRGCGSVTETLGACSLSGAGIGAPTPFARRRGQILNLGMRLCIIYLVPGGSIPFLRLPFFSALLHRPSPSPCSSPCPLLRSRRPNFHFISDHYRSRSLLSSLHLSNYKDIETTMQNSPPPAETVRKLKRHELLEYLEPILSDFPRLARQIFVDAAIDGEVFLERCSDEEYLFKLGIPRGSYSRLAIEVDKITRKGKSAKTIFPLALGNVLRSRLAANSVVGNIEQATIVEAKKSRIEQDPSHDYVTFKMKCETLQRVL